LKQNNYQEAMGQITTPPALKEQTRQTLLAQTRKRTPLRLRHGFSVLAAALVLLFGLHLWMGTGDNLIVTDLTLGAHVEIVILQDGELHFSALTADDLEPPIRLAPNFPLRRPLSLDEYQGVLPVHIPEGLSAPEGGITAFFSEPTGAPEAILGRASYQTDSGGVLTLAFTNNSALLYLPVGIAGSQIAGTSVGLGFLETDGTYYAAYWRGGYLFLLTTEGIEQYEFVRLLYAFVSN